MIHIIKNLYINIFLNFLAKKINENVNSTLLSEDHDGYEHMSVGCKIQMHSPQHSIPNLAPSHETYLALPQKIDRAKFT